MHALILNYSKCINISPCMFGNGGGCASIWTWMLMDSFLIGRCGLPPLWSAVCPGLTLLARSESLSWPFLAEGHGGRGGRTLTLAVPLLRGKMPFLTSERGESNRPTLPLISHHHHLSSECHKVSAHLKTVVASLTYNSPLFRWTLQEAYNRVVHLPYERFF